MHFFKNKHSELFGKPFYFTVASLAQIQSHINCHTVNIKSDKLKKSTRNQYYWLEFQVQTRSLRTMLDNLKIEVLLGNQSK